MTAEATTRPARKDCEPIAVEIVLPVKFDPPVVAP